MLDTAHAPEKMQYPNFTTRFIDFYADVRDLRTKRCFEPRFDRQLFRWHAKDTDTFMRCFLVMNICICVYNFDWELSIPDRG